MKKAAFILCSNDELQLKKSFYFLDRLQIPNGMETERIVIRDAHSMTEGYNRAMRSSNATYKIYLHQDVWILKKDFLAEIDRIFSSHPKLGLMGMVGSSCHIPSGTYFSHWNTGTVDSPINSVYDGCNEGDELKPVVAVDGLLLITQHDIPWREDLFSHFDYYDISASFEMTRDGWDVAVPRQDIPWCYHNATAAKLGFYADEGKIMKEEYQDIFPFPLDETVNVYQVTREKTLADFTKYIFSLIKDVDRQQVNTLLKKYIAQFHGHSDLIRLTKISCIDELERNSCETNLFWKEGDGPDELIAKLEELVFPLILTEYGIDLSKMQNLLCSGRFSLIALAMTSVNYITRWNMFYQNMRDVFGEIGRPNEFEIFTGFCERLKSSLVPRDMARKFHQQS